MKPKRLVFEPIDLDAHVLVCVAFQRDSFICSFGKDGFFNEAGPNGVNYIERLRLRTTKFPDGYVHIWLGDKIVGQIEMQNGFATRSQAERPACGKCAQLLHQYSEGAYPLQGAA